MGCTMEFILAKGVFLKSAISETSKALVPCTVPSNKLIIQVQELFQEVGGADPKEALYLQQPEQM